MTQSFRAAFYFIGFVLVVAGAIILAQRWSNSDALEPLGPCVLLLLGAGIFAFGLFSNEKIPDDRQVRGNVDGVADRPEGIEVDGD